LWLHCHSYIGDARWEEIGIITCSQSSFEVRGIGQSKEHRRGERREERGEEERRGEERGERGGSLTGK
jgi:hypothetical protein